MDLIISTLPTCRAGYEYKGMYNMISAIQSVKYKVHPLLVDFMKVIIKITCLFEKSEFLT